MLDKIARSRTWDGLSPARLIPLLESAALQTVAPGDTLFEQYHPAAEFYLLTSGTAIQSTTTAARTEMVQVGTVDWPNAALGWSGFLPPHRYGSTVTARNSLRLLRWSFDHMANVFYSDPEVSIRFFALILDSISRQFVNLRQQRVDTAAVLADPPQAEPAVERRPVVGRADSLLRRSAFFSSFDESSIDAFADAAVLESWQPGTAIVRQGEPTGGLMLLAGGRCNTFFEKGDGSARLLPFRRFHHRYGIIAGIPDSRHEFVAEATVFAETHCWVYRLPAESIHAIMTADAEFGRAFQQRLLARFAGLVGSIQVDHQNADAEPEVAVVANTLARSRARLPVTSELYKVPHLLRHRLTLGNAFAVLKKVAETGRYHERMLAATCSDLIGDLAAENAFYQGILRACEAVIASDDTLPHAAIREACDRAVDEAFAFLDCRITGLDNLPDTGGNVFILNHLACPDYYELPNHFHFSFDTAFVSCIVWRRYGQSAIRVVRDSPDAEFGHNLFYRRLDHISVPTLESGVDGVSNEAFAAMRRDAGEEFARRGREALAAGMNLVVCPEGQSQAAELSPSRFHTGAFRLALDTGAPVVPVALGGFHRRFKDGPLVAVVGPPIDVAHEMRSAGHTTVREFADALRTSFTADVDAARTLAAQPPRLSHPES